MFNPGIFRLKSRVLDNILFSLLFLDKAAK